MLNVIKKLSSVALSGSIMTWLVPIKQLLYVSVTVVQISGKFIKYILFSISYSLSRSQLLTVFSSSSFPALVILNRKHPSKCYTVWCCIQNLNIWKYPRLAITEIHIKMCICKKKKKDTSLKYRKGC